MDQQNQSAGGPTQSQASVVPQPVNQADHAKALELLQQARASVDLPSLQEGASQSSATLSTPPAPSPKPVSGPHKEMAPIASPQSEAPLHEYMQPSHPEEMEPVIHPELKEQGVEVSPSEHQPKIPEEAKQIGVDHAKETVSMNPAQTSGGVVLPLTQAQAQEMQETAAITDSRKWYATLIMKLIKIHKHFLS